MAAAPVGALVTFALPRVWLDAVGDLADGVGDAVRAAGTVIVGGDVSRAGELSIAVTVLGSCARPLLRSGARPGDAVWVTGRLGGPASALQALLRGDAPAPALRERLVRPVPRIREARWLAEHGASAGVDISDGLAADLGHVAAASGAAIEIELERVPVVDGAAREAGVGGGEEFEVAVAGPADLDAAEFARRFGIPLTRVGAVVPGPVGVTVVDARRRVAPPTGWSHF
jgi:thiamine-monophosphate kinase